MLSFLRGKECDIFKLAPWLILGTVFIGGLASLHQFSFGCGMG